VVEGNSIVMELGFMAVFAGAIWAIVQSWISRGRQIKEIKNQLEVRNEVVKTIDKMDTAVGGVKSFHIDRLLGAKTSNSDKN
jgi:hypothetical protein